MHNRLSIRRYSVSTGALYTSCATGMGLQQVRKGVVSYEVYNEVMPHCKA